MKIFIISFYHHTQLVGGKRWLMFGDKLKENGHDVEYSSYIYKGRYKYSNYLLRLLITNTFYPDYRKAFVRETKKQLKENKYDLVISTYPPFGTLGIGYYAKKKYGCKWIIDMRDPFIQQTTKWVGETHFSLFVRMMLAIRYFKLADHVIFTTPPIRNEIYNTFRRWLSLDKVTVIHNCHD